MCAARKWVGLSASVRRALAMWRKVVLFAVGMDLGTFKCILLVIRLSIKRSDINSERDFFRNYSLWTVQVD